MNFQLHPCIVRTFLPMAVAVTLVLTLAIPAAAQIDPPIRSSFPRSPGSTSTPFSQDSPGSSSSRMMEDMRRKNNEALDDLRRRNEEFRNRANSNSRIPNFSAFPQTELETVYQCLSCRKSVVSAGKGQRCPHCGVIWTEVVDETSGTTGTNIRRSSPSSKSPRDSSAFFLGLAVIAVVFVGFLVAVGGIVLLIVFAMRRKPEPVTNSNFHQPIRPAGPNPFPSQKTWH